MISPTITAASIWTKLKHDSIFTNFLAETTWVTLPRTAASVVLSQINDLTSVAAITLIFSILLIVDFCHTGSLALTFAKAFIRFLACLNHIYVYLVLILIINTIFIILIFQYAGVGVLGFWYGKVNKNELRM